MENTVNSFTENANNLIKQANIAMQAMVSINDSLTTQNDTVNINIEQTDPITGDVSAYTYTIPSYNTVLSKLNSTLNTVNTFVKGEGVVLLNDGTYRKVSTTPVAISPEEITNIDVPTKFSVKDNWFFEDLMFPQLTVSFELKNKIDDRSDRVVVKRVIVNNPTSEDTQWFITNMMGTTRNYYDTITYLSEQGVQYWEDDEVLELPLYTEPYTGTFIITDKQTISGKEWYFLDTLYYGVTSDAPVVKNHQLAIGDSLRYGNSIWKIDDIQVNESRIHLVSLVGMDHPTINNSFNIYSSPFSTKQLDVAVGYDECNIIFLKGVNDDFNIISDSWGNGIAFYTNSLILNGGSSTLADYYTTYVADFGRQFEGQAKEKFIPAYYGITPDAPVFSADNFAVKQINTQINAALDTDSIKNTQTQIESTKTLINSLKTTISQQKSQLVELTDPGQRADLQSKITANINDLSKKVIEYDSLVKSLSTIAYENSAVTSDPKYRIRGFFAIPEPKNNQQVIQFEYAYRYLKLDNTGTSLDTYEYTDPCTGQVLRGVFTDWNVTTTAAKSKIYDVSTDSYIWATENISDSETNNINQIDIPITNGEKVELKIKSISEAGWPTNPLKSDWSSSVIIEFPSNLQGTNQITNILSDSVTEQEAIKFDETLSAAGVPTHLDDSFPNPNAGNGTYFKHQSINISYDLKTKDKDGVVSTVKTTDLQTQIENLSPYTYVTLTRPTGSVNAQLTITGTLQQLFQSIVDKDPSIYDYFVTLITT